MTKARSSPKRGTPGNWMRTSAAPPRRLSFFSHQRDCRVDLRRFRQFGRALLDDTPTLAGYDLEVSLLDDAAMTRLNEQFVHHGGTTDVITFDYTQGPPGSLRPALARRAPATSVLAAEMLLCPAEAVRQARRFRTTWQEELARYFIHGVLHLLGHDDLAPAPRRRMKRAENLLLRQMARRFPLARLKRSAPSRP